MQPQAHQAARASPLMSVSNAAPLKAGAASSAARLPRGCTGTDKDATYVWLLHNNSVHMMSMSVGHWGSYNSSHEASRPHRAWTRARASSTDRLRTRSV